MFLDNFKSPVQFNFTLNYTKESFCEPFCDVYFLSIIVRCDNIELTQHSSGLVLTLLSLCSIVHTNNHLLLLPDEHIIASQLPGGRRRRGQEPGRGQLRGRGRGLLRERGRHLLHRAAQPTRPQVNQIYIYFRQLFNSLVML